MGDIPAGYKRIEGSMRKPARGARLIGPADSKESVSVTVYVRRRPDAPPLLDHEYWAKTPPGKRKFLSRQEFATKYGAAQADIDKVTAFAASHGLKVGETSLAKRSVHLSGTVSQMSKAFAVKLGTYEVKTGDEISDKADDKPKGKSKIKDKAKARNQATYRGLQGDVHVPSELSEIVQNVLGLDNRPKGRHHNVPATAAVLTPPWVAQLYQFPAATAAVKNQTIGIIELGGGYSQSDIDAYFGTGPNASWSPLAATRTTHPTPGLIGPSGVAGTLVEVDVGSGTTKGKNDYPNFGSGEVTLDIVIASSVAQGAKIVVYFASKTSVDSNGQPYAGTADWAAVITAAIHDATNAPSVISFTWGGGAEDDPADWSAQDIQTITTVFQEAAMMGVTILVAAGDWGSDDAENDGKAHLDYPSSDPWVISCGGTIISNVNGASFDEGTWNDDGASPGSATGGGVSDVFSLPSWQANASVPLSKSPSGNKGRGIPDISGNASLYSGYNIVLGSNPWPLPTGSNGLLYANGGTSIVAPLYAALVAILNAILGEPVGFLNPTLYALNGTVAFRDINDGFSNLNPNSSMIAPAYGSGPGWDACTGLGSINGAALLAALQQMRPSVSLILDRSTFGKDEVNALIAQGPYTYQDAFYVVVDGFTPDELGLNAGNLTAPPNLPVFSGTFTGLNNDPGIKFDGATGVLLEQPGQFLTIQRITFPYNIKFSSVNAFSGLSANNTSQTYGLSAKITTAASANYPAIATPSSNTAEFELVFQADPFLVAGQSWWLSNDMRVFQVTPATLPTNKVPLTYSSTPYTSDPNTYIKDLIAELNASFTDPAMINTPFTGISGDEEQSALNLTGNDVNGNAVYNFALARVHLVGDVATDVRAFFRLFISTSPDTDFNTGTTFRSKIQTNANGNNIPGTLIPLLGFPSSDMSSTIPFFAEPRIDATTEPMIRQADPTNVQTITSAAGKEVVAYFGCWLDLNQSTPRFPLDPSSQANPDGPYASSAIQSIPNLIMSNHACLVTEISYDQDPIPPGANASTSDKIGQRNLSWAASDNPGPQDAHRVPTLFDLRHTSRNVPATALPDELMIEWGNAPAGSVATIYWPQLNADDVLKLAGRFYSAHVLSKKDASTIQCVTGKITYIPIPAGSGPNLAGLLTIDLPLSVRVGQEFDIVVRRLSSARTQKGNRPGSDTINWRYVVGAFQIRIPVSTGRALLASEESVLALFKWKLESLPPANRWYPVLQRYIQQLEGRVDGFGGNASAVEPSRLGATGVSVGYGPGRRRPEWIGFTGKVSGLIYDHFGDFEGFFLLTEEGHERPFRSREHEIEDLVRDAWVKRMVITVFADRRDPESPVSIILRRVTRPLRP